MLSSAGITKGKTPDPVGTLGTFSGVFTPSVLTILGIILFLRLGFVVGSAIVKRCEEALRDPAREAEFRTFTAQLEPNKR